MASMGDHLLPKCSSHVRCILLIDDLEELVATLLCDLEEQLLCSCCCLSH